MDTTPFTPLLTLVGAIIGLTLGLSIIKLKIDAERCFLAILSLEDRAKPLREIRARVMQKGVATAEELQQLVDLLDSFVQEMPAKYQRAIREGLHQDSMLGQARYVAKLMNRAGIGSGPIPIPVE